MNKLQCSIKEITISNIPLLFVYQSLTEHNKIVFLFHKLLENKFCELPMAYKLAREGYFVVVMDVHGHGEREDSFDKLGFYDFNMLYKDAYETAKDINTIIIYLKTLYQKLDYSSIICIGASNGANIAFMAGYLVQNVTHIISLIGSLNWEFSIKNRSLHTFQKFAKESSMFEYRIVQKDIQQYNPIHRFSTLEQLPYVLFQNSVLDATIHIDSAEDSFRKLTQIYKEKNQENIISLKKYKRTGHYVSKIMVDDLIEWLKSSNAGVVKGEL